MRWTLTRTFDEDGTPAWWLTSGDVIQATRIDDVEEFRRAVAAMPAIPVD